jgi:hypothetical protein
MVILVAAASPPSFTVLRWTKPGAELAVLSSQPAACLSVDPRHAVRVAAGQALFNTPTLLGGQAAKAGISCASCHVNGRGNPHFLLEGISREPGTADVSNSFFSVARHNGQFDPAPIPDLAAPGKISRYPDDPALAGFIRSLIVDEFAGAEPSAAMLDALAHYVRAIRPCPDGQAQAVHRALDDQLLLVHAALGGARDMAQRGDWQAADALVAGARQQLGEIAERYAGPGLARQRALLIRASRSLQALDAHRGQSAAFQQAAARWEQMFARTLTPSLRRSEDQSLYRAANVRRLLEFRSGSAAN